MKSKHFVLAVILMITGFIVAFSYQYANRDNNKPKVTNEQLKQENTIREQVINEQEANQKLEKQITQIRNKTQSTENNLAQQKTATFNLVQELNKYRLINGLTKVQGPGVKVTLSDAAYVPDGSNPNNYIVHQQDIQEVVYEFYAIGAEAVSINNQRITNHSYIECVGPVVKVDGTRHAAPFVIQAIGDPDMLVKSLEMNGNTADILRARGISVKIEKQDNIIMDSLM